MKVFNVLDEDSDDNLKQSSEGRFHPRSSEATIAEVNEDEEGVEIPMGFEANRLVPPLGQFSHESPLLGYPGASKSLVRVSTYASSLNQPGTSRHDSTSYRDQSVCLSRGKYRKQRVLLSLKRRLIEVLISRLIGLSTTNHMWRNVVTSGLRRLEPTPLLCLHRVRPPGGLRPLDNVTDSPVVVHLGDTRGQLFN
uniref:Uncharacterized protein n=1 Tax=Timema cristinae TaxID=61476 RepID=A0A7R9CLC8_TIMCR|nr:unnamed protein product [Timema cristinae]